MNEADTCRKQVVPRLLAAGWDEEPQSIAEQRTVSGAACLQSRRSRA
jgi:type I restriction enzyme R subunit